MKLRAALVAVAVVAAAGLASAQDKSGGGLGAKVVEMRSRKKFPFADLRFYLDLTKLRDQRWNVADLKPIPKDAEGVVFDASIPAGSTNDFMPAMRIVVQRWPQYKEADGKRQVVTLQFKAAGMSVPVSDVDRLCLAFYTEWKQTASEFDAAKSSAPAKKDVGPSKIDGWAVARDVETKKMQRRDWFAWSVPSPGVPITYVAQVTTIDPNFEDPRWVDKLFELVKNILPMDERTK